MNWRLLLALAAALAARGTDLAVIVHGANSLENLSLAELRTILLGQRGHWPSGKRITVVMRDSGEPDRTAVLQAVCRMSESEYNRAIEQAVYNGALSGAPKQLNSAAGIRKFVFNVPGAIGIIASSEVDKTVKVIRIDGLAPGDPKYKLRRP